MKFDEPYLQCHFAYDCLKDKQVIKAGWYICFQIENLKGEKLPWRVKQGPVRKESDAKKIGREIFNDIGKPKRLSWQQFKLTKSKPNPNL